MSSTTATHASHSSSRQANSNSTNYTTTGVADYFAILGVGNEKLVWKHNQKSSFGIVQDEEEDAVVEDSPEELQTRFGREIVQLCIVVDKQMPQQQNNHQNYHTDASASASVASSSISQQQQQQSQNMSIPQVTSFTSEGASSVNLHSMQPGLHSLPPNSPSHSEATSNTTMDAQHRRGGGASAGVPQLLKSTTSASTASPTTALPEGWTMIMNTVPTLRPGHVLYDSDVAAADGASSGLDPTASSFSQQQQQQYHSQQQHQHQYYHRHEVQGPLLWSANATFGANLNLNDGLRDQVWQLQAKTLARESKKNDSLPLATLRRKMESLYKHRKQKRILAPQSSVSFTEPRFYLAYRRRTDLCVAESAAVSDQSGHHHNQSASMLPAIADVNLYYVRLHRDCLDLHQQTSTSAATNENPSSSYRLPGSQLWKSYYQSQTKHPTPDDKRNNDSEQQLIDVLDFLALPGQSDEWVLPDEFRFVRDLRQPHPHRSRASSAILLESSHARDSSLTMEEEDRPDHSYYYENDGMGVEAMDVPSVHDDASAILPKLLSTYELPDVVDDAAASLQQTFLFVPILAIRRQRITDEERFHEDPAAVELALSFCDGHGRVVEPNPTYTSANADGEDGNEEEEEEEEEGFHLLGMTTWRRSRVVDDMEMNGLAPRRQTRLLGAPSVMLKHNRPFGFCDATFATKVHGRFPFKNYKDLPLPEEELPMFCYPTGCRLHRACFSDAPLPQYYGFVVKNERGDSIYVSCVSFMEPLGSAKEAQLAAMSERRKYTSLAHRAFCEARQSRNVSEKYMTSAGSDISTEVDSSCVLTGFDDMTTFENKTICLVSRYPFWTSFRKFLSHLHTLSRSSYEIPLERFISHLLLSVPVPKPGGPNVIVALPDSDPMILQLPAEKDFPLVDLPFERLVACLDIKTIVMVVLGMLVLERKVIILSTRPSLVLDVCELLRSLLFPFDLCAPYVPRLTEPFKSSLDFPGAIFVGIHNDGTDDGLAATVKRELPEDSIIVDLDTGQIDCDGDKHELIKTAWDIIPEIPRSALVSELQILCRDAAIVDGQEPLDSQLDSAFDVTLTAAVDDFGVSNQSRELLDDRAIRDAFFRFFCAVLGGYDSFLVAPDADFLVSGNEWFDTQGFLNSVSSARSAYVAALVGTQLFQAFIQKRTEASDVHCLLFDECLATYHADAKPYGRLGDDMETTVDPGSDMPPMMYSLLVDQAAVIHDQSLLSNHSMDASEADSSFSQANTQVSTKFSECMVNASGDLVTAASTEGLAKDVRYVYCVDGNPCFPLVLERRFLLPLEPTSWNLQIPKADNPLLARSGRELEDAERQRKKATSRRGMQQKRRCLWQLPKLMGSHVLGTWLLCIPARVSMGDLSHEQQSKYFLQALGALRGLRSKQRIVPDEAGYRALMVACGRTESDRRVELVKLWGLLRSDGIFPSAVTLGQYTRALAEGYSKRISSEEHDYAGLGYELPESSSRVGRASVTSVNWKGSHEFETSVVAFDGYLTELETHGRRWRQKSSGEKYSDRSHQKKKRSNRPWLPVAFSSSFVPFGKKSSQGADSQNVRFLAIWSRTRACSNCGYIPLEEEVQAGWDVTGEDEIPGAVACARCSSVIVPMLAYKELDPEEALEVRVQGQGSELPPQISSSIQGCDDAEYVTYISPMAMRTAIEQLVETNGEDALVRDQLRETDPQLFVNLWWYSARFSLPLPLPVVQLGDSKTAHYCTFAGWDKSSALRGCTSGAKALLPLWNKHGSYDSAVGAGEVAPVDPFDDVPMLSRYNLQGFHSNVWDQPDLSKILVALVEACDKRDFKPVIESGIHAALKHNGQPGDDNGELDTYRTILYLAKYQCTSAFHSFFPTTLKACKGYHYWCPQGKPVPAFDRLIREAVHRIHSGKDQTLIVPVHEVSDVALGFRSVFGHLI